MVLTRLVACRNRQGGRFDPALGAGRCAGVWGRALLSAGPDARPTGRVRRARSQAEPRRIYQQVTLTEAEREQLRARAAELGVSVPRLMVESALSGVETPTDRRLMIAELFEGRRLLARDEQRNGIRR